jgi:hypothetical protein
MDNLILDALKNFSNVKILRFRVLVVVHLVLVAVHLVSEEVQVRFLEGGYQHSVGNRLLVFN